MVFHPKEHSAMQGIVDVIHEIRQEEKIRCAMLEAGVMKGRDYNCLAILDHIERKYADVKDIRKIVGEYLIEFVVKGESFGFTAPCQKKGAEMVSRAFRCSNK